MDTVDLRQHIRTQRRGLESVDALLELRKRRRADDHRPVVHEPAGPAEGEAQAAERPMLHLTQLSNYLTTFWLTLQFLP